MKEEGKNNSPVRGGAKFTCAVGGRGEREKTLQLFQVKSKEARPPCTPRRTRPIIPRLKGLEVRKESTPEDKKNGAEQGGEIIAQKRFRPQPGGESRKLSKKK